MDATAEAHGGVMSAPDESDETASLERVEGDITRLTYLTDAAVAISLTLLFLPAVDIIQADQSLSWSDIITTKGSDLTWIGTTFIVLVVCWRYHHVLFEYLRDYDRIMVWLNFFWLFCLLSIPLMTLADLPPIGTETKITGPIDFMLRVLLVRGDEGDTVQNFLVYWSTVGISFLALFAIARRAAYGNRDLKRSGDDTRLSSRIYLRPALVCFSTGILGAVWVDQAHWFLWIGIVVVVVIAQVEQRRMPTKQKSD